MASSQPLSIASFPAWARLNNVDFTNAELRETDVKGIGLVAARGLKTTTTTTAQPAKETTSNANEKGDDLSVGDGKDGERARTETAIGGQDEGKDTDHDPVQLLRIPQDLVLSAAAIEEYTKVDQNFRQLLDVAGHQVTPSALLEPFPRMDMRLRVV